MPLRGRAVPLASCFAGSSETWQHRVIEFLRHSAVRDCGRMVPCCITFSNAPAWNARARRVPSLRDGYQCE
eukprot:4008667-Lingulodinium_polyedra.AAC.1